MRDVSWKQAKEEIMLKKKGEGKLFCIHVTYISSSWGLVSIDCGEDTIEMGDSNASGYSEWGAFSLRCLRCYTEYIVRGTSGPNEVGDTHIFFW